MIRRLLATTSVPALVFGATLLPAAPAVPLVNLVDEQTMFALSSTDVPALVRGWDAGPLATTWNDSQVVRFLAPLRAEMKLDEWDNQTRAATGLTVRELLALAQGEALFAVPAFDFAKFDSKDAPPFLLALEVGDQAEKIKKILADSLAKENVAEETELFAGVEVHTRPQFGVKGAAAADTTVDADAASEPAEPAAPETISWTIVDGVWLISADKQRVFKTIDAFQQGGVGTALGKSERFLRTRERVGDAQALAYVNFPAIYPALRDLVAVTKAKNNAGGVAGLGIDPEILFAAFGLDALGEAYLAIRIQETETRLDAGMLYSDERGLLKLMAYQPGAAPQPDWIPAKWPSVSTARFSLPKFYEGLEELVHAISPMIYGMAQGRINSFNKALRIDIRRDLIGSFGDELVSAYALPPGLEGDSIPSWTEMDQLIAFSLSNEAAFTKSVEALKSLAGPAAEQMFLKRDYLGHTIYTINQPTAPGAKAPRGFSYAIANGVFLIGIGSPAVVESSLQGMAAGEGLFWKRDDVRAALATVPSEASGVQVQDLRVMMAAFVETAVQMQEQANDRHTDGNRKVFLDVSAKPDADAIARHWGVSAGYFTRTPEGIFSTSRIAHPKK